MEIGRTRMTLGDALALGPGSIVGLHRMAGGPSTSWSTAASSPVARSWSSTRSSACASPTWRRRGGAGGSRGGARPRGRPPAEPSVSTWPPEPRRRRVFSANSFARTSPQALGHSSDHRGVKRSATFTALALLMIDPTAALAAVKGPGEDTPLNLPSPDSARELGTAPGAGGGSLVRTFFGLAVVVAVIYGLYWMLRQVKKSREERAHSRGCTSRRRCLLGPNRSLNLVRVGRELVLVGVAEHGRRADPDLHREESRRARHRPPGAPRGAAQDGQALGLHPDSRQPAGTHARARRRSSPEDRARRLGRRP